MTVQDNNTQIGYVQDGTTLTPKRTDRGSGQHCISSSATPGTRLYKTSKQSSNIADGCEVLEHTCKCCKSARCHAPRHWCLCIRCVCTLWPLCIRCVCTLCVHAVCAGCVCTLCVHDVAPVTSKAVQGRQAAMKKSCSSRSIALARCTNGAVCSACWCHAGEF